MSLFYTRPADTGDVGVWFAVYFVLSCRFCMSLINYSSVCSVEVVKGQVFKCVIISGFVRCSTMCVNSARLVCAIFRIWSVIYISVPFLRYNILGNDVITGRFCSEGLNENVAGFKICLVCSDVRFCRICFIKSCYITWQVSYPFGFRTTAINVTI